MNYARGALLAIGSCLAVLALGTAAFFANETALPTYADVRADFRPSDQWLLDRSGQPIEQTRIDRNGRRLSWITLSDISPAMQTEVVLQEDRTFFEHRGVDFRALSSSLVQSIKRIVGLNGYRRGGSTISMQVAAMIEKSDDLQDRPGRRSPISKLKQIRQAFALERTWSKSQILETYLNLAHYRGEIQGIAAASRLLLEKDPHGLQATESQFLAKSLSAPSSRISAVVARLCRSTSSAKSSAKISECEAFRELGAKIETRGKRDHVAAHLAPHAAKFVSKLSNGEAVLHSTLDRELQETAIALATEQLLLLKRQNVNDASVLVVDNETGHVLVYVGNVSSQSSATFIDGVQTRRQAGSTLKPFIYGTAFDLGILKPNSLLADQPLEVDTGRGLYRPKNYDKKFRGVVSVTSALASSMNIPAVKALELIEPFALVQKMKELGFTNMNSGEDYGLSLALGTADVSLWELVKAYRAFAHGGLAGDLKLTSSGRSPDGSARVFTEFSAYRIGKILSDREARSATFGLENPLATRFWTAVKTGTSKDMRDNWCIGFSSRYTVGVWVGNFNGDAMWDVSGISGAAPIWLGLMNTLHRSEPSHAPLPSKEFQALAASDAVDLQPITSMKFRKILLPASGSVMASDSDIPSALQRVWVQASGELDSSVRWELNGKTISSGRNQGGRTPFLDLKPGRYHLKLLSRNGVEDESHFTVR